MTDDLDARWRLRVFRRQCARRRAQLARVRSSPIFNMLVESFNHKTSPQGRERAVLRLARLLDGMAVPAGARLAGPKPSAFFYLFAPIGSPIIDGAGCGIRVKALSLRRGQEFTLIEVPDADLVGATDHVAVLVERAGEHLRRNAERRQAEG